MSSTPSERLAHAAATFHDDPDAFDGAAEPMRAIRDLINVAEAIGLVDFSGDDRLLDRARDGFTTLRKLAGDDRPGDAIADAEMMEPRARSLPEIIEALQLASAALQVLARNAPQGEQTPIYFTGAWLHFAPRTVASILDAANRALEGST